MNTAHAAEFRSTLRRASQMGRHGDDRLAHINGYEAAVLKALGGAGTRNPKTNLEEYYDPDAPGAPKGPGSPKGGTAGGGIGQGGKGGGSFKGSGPGFSDAGYANAADTGYSAPGAKPSQGGAGGHAAVGTGSSTAADALMAEKYGVTPDAYMDEVSDYADRIADSLNSGNTELENLGNVFAGFLGFNEQPVADLDFNPSNPVGPRASWGWDPAVAAASALGAGFGVPLTGLVADQISSAAGRPLSIDLGPSVIGSDTTDPVTGEAVIGDKTYAGGNVTVRDPGDHNTYFGVSPTHNAMLQGINSVAPPAPKSTTVTGTDPVALEPTPVEPSNPELPDVTAPEPIDPGNVQVDPGNTQLTDSQLTDLFVGAMRPRTYKGKTKSTVIV